MKQNKSFIQLRNNINKVIFILPLLLIYNSCSHTRTNPDLCSKYISSASTTDDLKLVDNEPMFTYDELLKKIVYPEKARKNGIEGKVIVRVLIDELGKVINYKIECSDSDLLNDASIKALLEYDHFIPANIKGKPVKCWASIPVTFKLW
ncbi:MAG: TonB protein [Ignavibacteria bacterium]|nr:TonB protein [Ignavibacteria bacterium]